MELKIVNLYQYFGLSGLDNGNGTLLCYIQKTDAAISNKRMRPGVLILPGGGYSHVSAREAEPVALRLLARGYCAFVLQYAVNTVRFPVALREAAMAMRYIRENAQQLQVDPGMVAAMGFSAGGHLCGTLGTMFDAPEVADIGSAQQLRPDVLGMCYPVAVSWGRTHEGSFDYLCGDDRALRQRLSLDRLVRPDMPPMFIWHTRDDNAVPCRNSLLLAQAAEEAGVDFALHIYRHGPHGLSTADVQCYRQGRVPDVSADVGTWMDTMMDFFSERGFGIRDEEETV
jgi:acetyl esterase/lipase